jgi:spoIIIJ-associated protein
VAAATGDDNSGGLITTDTADAGGDAPAAGQQPGAELAAPADAEHDEVIAERDVVTAEDGQAEAQAGEESPADAASGAPGMPDLEQESEIAADYIEGLLDVADLDGDIDMDVDGDRPVVSVVGATLTELVGPHGEVLEALQELTRLAVHRQTGARSRIMLDVGGYRAHRREELAELGRKVAEEVGRTGVPQRLDAMTPFERRSCMMRSPRRGCGASPKARSLLGGSSYCRLKRPRKPWSWSRRAEGDVRVGLNGRA